MGGPSPIKKFGVYRVGDVPVPTLFVMIGRVFNSSKLLSLSFIGTWDHYGHFVYPLVS